MDHNDLIELVRKAEAALVELREANIEAALVELQEATGEKRKYLTEEALVHAFAAVAHESHDGQISYSVLPVDIAKDLMCYGARIFGWYQALERSVEEMQALAAEIVNPQIEYDAHQRRIRAAKAKAAVAAMQATATKTDFPTA